MSPSYGFSLNPRLYGAMMKKNLKPQAGQQTGVEKTPEKESTETKTQNQKKTGFDSLG